MRIRPLALTFALALGACTPATRAAPAPEATAATISAELEQSAQEWNRGNLDAFLLPYSDSPGTTFVGSSGLVRGKQAIREKYVASYFHPGGTLPGLLSFRDMDVRPLGPDHALAVGRWIISDRASGRQTAAGIFSLVFERTPQGWRIIHDHSS
jgi:ketosteroid isomerase-like protein